MSACKPVSSFLPVFLYLLRSSSIKYPVCFYPRLLVPGSPCRTVTISWSKLIRDSEAWNPLLIGRGPDIPVRVCTCVKMRVLLQSDRERGE